MRTTNQRSGTDSCGKLILIEKKFRSAEQQEEDEEMGKYQRDISELGHFGIVRETVSISYDNAATLFWIQVTMVLPAMIAFVASGQLLDVANHALGPSSASGDFSLLRLIELIAVYVVTFLINQAISVAPYAAICYTVGCSYTGKSVTFTEVVQSLPKLWARLLVTGLWGSLIACIVLLINAVINLGIFAFLSSKPSIMIPLILLTTVDILVFCFYFGTILQVASGVTTLEENYGLAALSKAEQLLRGKWAAAWGLFLIYVVPFGTLAYANESVKRYSNWGEHEAIKRLSTQALLVLLNSLVLQWSSLSGGCLYVACKAFHHESIVLYVSLDHHNLERFSNSPQDSAFYAEKEDPGNIEPRPSFGRAAFSGGQLMDELEAILARAGPYRPIDTPRHSVSSVDELEVRVDSDIEPELSLSSRTRRGRGKGPMHQ